MKKYICLGMIALLGFSMNSCKNALDVQPKESIDVKDALTSKEGFQTATVGIYSYLRKTNQYGRQLIVYPEIMSNTAAHKGTGTGLLTLSNNARGAHMTPWSSAYTAIAQINIVLTELEAFDADQEWKNGIAGQLHFLRALFFHNAAKVYSYDPTAKPTSIADRGTIPLNLKPVYSYENVENLERASNEDLYAQLYDDLDKAYQYLANTSKSKAPHLVTQGAVAAFFSRVALYNGDYKRVIVEADKALASGIGKLSTRGSYVSDWRAGVHPESMFEVEFKTDQNVGIDNAPRADFTNRLNAQDLTTVSGRGNAMVSDELFALYDDADVRKGLILKGLGSLSASNQMTKFLSRGGSPNLDNIPVIRISEVYLNRAEANARQQGKEQESIDDINIIRVRAGLNPVSGLMEDALMDEVLKQRKLELAFEGHSFFDYKRLGMDIIKPGGKVFAFSDYRVVAGIPWREISANKKLRQNYLY